MRLIKPSRSLKPMGLTIKSKTISKKVVYVEPQTNKIVDKTFKVEEIRL